ncbi:MAG TPA: carotenoid biosynthesis protein [Chloroflexia bacterium]|nr:carotenoid biosynthesis protein [Chloroflexia bacterium]
MGNVPSATPHKTTDRLRPLAERASRLRPAEWVMLVAFGLYAFVFPFGVVLLSFGWMPFGMEWMSSLLLGLLGVACAGWMWTNYGPVGGVVSAAVFALGVALEYVGVLTGAPFGRYTYTGVLVPEFPGGVPAAIGFAWLLVVVGGLFTARRLIGAVRPLALALAGAMLAVGLDLLLEPVAFHVKGYWLWAPDPNGYYGIPWSNFATWLAASFALNLLAGWLTRWRGPREWTWLPITLYAMNVAMFGTVNLAHGFWVSGLVAVGLMALVWLGARRARAIVR